ncbi:MAG: hypothetical protein SOW90_04230 [Gallibacter sp.]|nr:hypothetical protein [Gallibacter sp.]
MHIDHDFNITYVQIKAKNNKENIDLEINAEIEFKHFNSEIVILP